MRVPQAVERQGLDFVQSMASFTIFKKYTAAVESHLARPSAKPKEDDSFAGV